MSRKTRRATQFANRQIAQAQPTQDSFENVAARMGVNGLDNIASQANYNLNPLTRQRVRLEHIYRGSWVAAVAIDSVADDMTRAGIDFATDVEADDAEKLQNAYHRLGIWSAFGDALRWARLYGGALAVMLIDGHDFEEPLDKEKIGPDQFKGMYVMSRWEVMPSYQNLIMEFGPDFGKPEFYEVVAEASQLSGLRGPLYGKRIHHSRVFRFEGAALPFYQRVTEFGWGMSIIERIYDRIVSFDSATQGMSQLVYKAHLRTVKIEGLKQILGAGGGPAYEALVAELQAIRQFQSSEGLTIIDAKDEMEYSAYAFAGLPEIITHLGKQIGGGIQVPMVRFFGESPSGMNSTGDSDWRNYYDGINKDQENKLRIPLTDINEILYRSELKKEMPDSVNFMFSPLWQTTDQENATYAKTIGDAVSTLEMNGVISHATSLKELRKASTICGVFTSITDEDIEEAENEPPNMSEMELGPENIQQLQQHPQLKPAFNELSQQEKEKQALAKNLQNKPSEKQK